MAEIWHPWDTLMKFVMHKGAQALASLVLPGVRVGQPLDYEQTDAKTNSSMLKLMPMDPIPLRP
jgi:hypothetical protein